jgi:hypothetical protein
LLFVYQRIDVVFECFIDSLELGEFCNQIGERILPAGTDFVPILFRKPVRLPRGGTFSNTS